MSTPTGSTNTFAASIGVGLVAATVTIAAILRAAGTLAALLTGIRPPTHPA